MSSLHACLSCRLRGDVTTMSSWHACLSCMLKGDVTTMFSLHACLFCRLRGDVTTMSSLHAFCSAGSEVTSPQCPPLSISNSSIFMACASLAVPVSGFCNHSSSNIDILTECLAENNATATGYWSVPTNCSDVTDVQTLWTQYGSYEFRLFGFNAFSKAEALCNQHDATLPYITEPYQNFPSM